MKAHLILAVIVLSGSGCIPYTKEIMNSHRLGGDYIVGQQYILKKDATLVDLKSHSSPTETYYFWKSVPRYALTGPNDYRNGPHDKPTSWPKVCGIVPAGTTLEFTRLVYHYYFEDETTYPFAVLLDGQFAGKHVAIDNISIREDPCRYFHDPTWLQKKTTANKPTGGDVQ